MNKRDRWVTGVRLLREYLHDDLVLARTLRDRRWADFLAAAEIIHNDVDPELAVTDPVLYKALRDAITKAHLRGYPRLFLPRRWRTRPGYPGAEIVLTNCRSREISYLYLWHLPYVPLFLTS